MKKTVLYIVIAAAVVALISGLAIFSACSHKDANEADDGTERGTVVGSEHLTDAPDQTVTFPEQTTEQPTEQPTEVPTEAPTEKPTEAPTEAPTETEAETEPPQSLKYYSYGNGTCAVCGIGDYKDLYVIIPERSPSGEIVIAIDDKAFYDNTKIKAIQIPSTVMSIGEQAFVGCSSLVYISVSETNMAFSESGGVLYSKDKTKLIFFPSANPATEITISVNVTEICDMAFSSSPGLKLIRYGGTLQDWSKIKIGDKNYGLYSASMTFAITQ